MDAARVTVGPPVAYDRDACSYDRRTASYQNYRRDTVNLLPVRRGDVVVAVRHPVGDLCELRPFGTAADSAAPLSTKTPSRTVEPLM
jgi:hypothetical protein